MPRLFTLEQATALLPRVERHLRDALFARQEYEQAQSAFAEFQQRIQMSGGALVDRDKATRLVARRGASSTILRQELEAIAELGVQVKDLEIGLIDFPTRYRGEEVLLCWRLGEEAISHWHGVSEGFRGRRAIDDEFRATHRGDSEA